MFYKNKNLKILAIGSAVPKNKIDRNFFKKKYGPTIENKIYENTRIKSRYLNKKNQTTLGLSIKLIKKMNKKIKWDLNKVDAIIYISQSNEIRAPGASFMVQKQINANKGCLCIDLNYGCSAYPIGLYIAAMLSANSKIKKILLIVGDNVSKFLNMNDRSTASLFGDAVSVSFIENKKNNKHIFFCIGSDGRGYESLVIKKIGNREILNMNGMEVFSFALREVPKMINEILKKSKLKKSYLKHLILHQANNSMNDLIAEKTIFNKKNNLKSIYKFGNTNGASIPITICLNRSVIQNKNFYSLLVGYGIGLSWSSCIVSLKNAKIFPILYI